MRREPNSALSRVLGKNEERVVRKRRKKTSAKIPISQAIKRKILCGAVARVSAFGAVFKNGSDLSENWLNPKPVRGCSWIISKAVTCCIFRMLSARWDRWVELITPPRFLY